MKCVLSSLLFFIYCNINLGQINIAFSNNSKINPSATNDQKNTQKRRDVDAGEDTTTCKNSPVQLNATGEGNFFWSPSDGLNDPGIQNPTASPSKTTTYTVFVDGPNGIEIDSVTVFIEEIKANAGKDVSICDDGSIQLKATGGITYSWKPTNGLSDATIPNPIASPKETTTYTLTVKNESGTCSAKDKIEILVGQIIADGGNDVIICEGGSAQMKASGSDNYSWTPEEGLSATNINNPIANPTVTTTYTVKVSNESGQCVDTDEITVKVGEIEANAGKDKSSCYGEVVRLKASGGAKYSWLPTEGLSNPNIASPEASPTETTTYEVTVTDESGKCVSSTDDIIVEVSEIQANAGEDSKICPNGSTELNASGGTKYSWTPAEGLSSTTIPNPVATPNITTVYTVTVADYYGKCISTDEVRITVGEIIVDAGLDKAICSGDSTLIIAKGGEQYSWLPTDGLSNPNIAIPIAFPQQTTTYTVTVSDASNTCNDTDEITIYVGEVVADFSFESSCEGDSIAFIDNSTFIDGVDPSWYWDFDDDNNSDLSNPVHLYENAGTFNVTLIAKSGNCSGTTTKPVEIFPKPKANFVASPGIASTDNPSFKFYDKSLNAIVGTWYFGDGNSSNYNPGEFVSHTYKLNNQGNNGLYEFMVELQVENEFGCKDRIKYPVIVKAIWSFYMPNSFTPNNDGVNDVFTGIGNGFEDFEIEIYNKWGELVFKDNDMLKGWDGLLKNGNPATQNLYIWKVNVKDLDGKNHKILGHVNLFK